MPCNTPLAAWRTKTPGDSGRLGVTFNFSQADQSLPVEIPCGRCIGCRLERARSWAIRILHEAKLHQHNHFVTFTYNDASLPSSVQGLPTLQPEHFTRFMKRLRKWNEARLGGEGPTAPSPCPLPQLPSAAWKPTHRPSAGHSTIGGIRYYQCGEYGETTSRPHHHAILFNLYLPDLKPIRLTRAKNPAHALYTSETLERIWSHGIISVGRVTFETAAYVAAYVTKKITGPKAEEHYRDRVPEYSTMSRRPGIGSGFAAQYENEIYEADSVIIRGLEMRPPKFYDRALEGRDPDRYYEVRDRRANAPRRKTTHREREARELLKTQQQRKRDAT